MQGIGICSYICSGFCGKTVTLLESVTPRAFSYLKIYKNNGVYHTLMGTFTNIERS